MNAVALDWIPRVLSPNARPHYMAKHKAVREYRATAFYRGRGQKRLQNPFVAVLPLVSTRRRRDIDNVLAGLKSALDGLTDAEWWNDDHDIVGYHMVPEIMHKAWGENSIVIVACEEEELPEMQTRIAEFRKGVADDQPHSSLKQLVGNENAI